MQLVLPRLPFLVRLHNRPRHDADLELLRQLPVSVQVILPLLAEGRELRVLGHPVREVVFGEDGELGAFGSGGSYENGGFGEVVGGVEGLRGREYQLVGGEMTECDLTEMEDLGVELDDGNLVRRCHGEGLRNMFIDRFQARLRRISLETWRGN